MVGAGSRHGPSWGRPPHRASAPAHCHGDKACRVRVRVYVCACTYVCACVYHGPTSTIHSRYEATRVYTPGLVQKFAQHVGSIFAAGGQRASCALLLANASGRLRSHRLARPHPTPQLVKPAETDKPCAWCYVVLHEVSQWREQGRKRPTTTDSPPTVCRGGKGKVVVAASWSDKRWDGAGWR